MTDKELISKVHSSIYNQCKSRGYATPVDVLIDVGVLQKQKYEEWRFAKIPYLESVCNVNLRKLSFLMNQIRAFAKQTGLTPSFCYYKQWGMKKKDGQGHKPVRQLRFSKSGNPDIEKAYATHYVDKEKISQLKMEKETH